MKKSVFAMAAMLTAATAFVSCSNEEVFEEGAAEKAYVQQTEAKYKEAFVAHFGEVAANQSWDFSNTNHAAIEGQEVAQTRGWGDVTYFEVPTWKRPSIFDSNNLPAIYRHVYTDQADVIACAEDESLNPIDWPYDFAEVKIHPFYGKGSHLLNSCGFGVHYKSYEYEGLLNTYTHYENEGLFSFQLGNGWGRIFNHDPLLGLINSYSYRYVKTTNMDGTEGFYWWTQAGNNAKTPLKKCKQFTVNGHTYIALDCNGDGQYTDIVCWVEDLAPSKRYMVEDLGSIGDFDFNDIVFDVEYNSDKKCYECVVRAMGGTLDFTIKVGDTSWTKSEHYTASDIMNTKPNVDYEKELARFPVTGWIPEQNKVEVTVHNQKGTFVMPFPKDGEIPYIVATSIGKDWADEYVDVKTIGWFGYVANDVTKTAVTE